ncbi:MAG: MFS transporter [Parcubacteria group bacterium]|nr:MFS transporter [Parcubacteria group bacterium]
MNRIATLCDGVRLSNILPLMILVGVYYFLQGLGGNPGFHAQALDLFLKNNLGLNPAGQASFMFLVTIPWMIKPLYGFLSDSVPIFGYRRKSYFFIASFLSLGAYILISFFGYSYTTVLALYFIAMVGYACSDVLCDAVMVERGKPLQATDRLQSAQWLSISCAGVIVTFFGGYIAEYLSFQNAVLISAVAPCIVIFVTARFLKEEKSVSVADASRKAWLGVKEALKMKPIWGCAIFLFLFNMQPGLGTVLYNYQIDVLKFTQVQIGHIGTISQICFIVGALVYAAFCSKLSERVLLNGIIAVGCLTTLAYLFYDNLATAFIVSGSTSFIGVITFLGVLTLAARVCPENAEGTVFALLMSMTNFGARVGNIIGANIYEMFHYKPLVILSALFVACMWFFLPLVRSKPITRRLS